MTHSLSDVFELHRKLGHVPFSDVVLASSGHRVIPIDISSPEDMYLIKELDNSLRTYTKYASSQYARFHGNRINDVGKNFENAVLQAIDKSGLSIIKLTKMGYPDFKLIQESGNVSYLEIKVSGTKNRAVSSLRSFYYSSPNKIDSDARHLLLQVRMEEEADKYWKAISWEVRDLSSLEVQLKTEFNGGSKEISKTVLIIRS